MGKRQQAAESADELRHGGGETDRAGPGTDRLALTRARASGDLGDEIGGRKLSVLERTDARITVAEQVLIEHNGDRYKAASALRDMWGLARREATRFVSAAVARWEREAETATLAERRAIFRARVRDMYERALKHEKPLVVGDGGGAAHVEMWPEAQERQAIDALRLESQLDGLLEQSDAPAVTVNVRTEVLSVLERHYGAKAVFEAEGESVPALPADREQEP